MKWSRHYTNLSAAEVQKALIEQRDYREEELPAERTFRSILTLTLPFLRLDHLNDEGGIPVE